MLIGLLQLDLEEFQDLHEVEMTEAIDRLNSIRELLIVQLTKEDTEKFDFVVNQINFVVKQINYYDDQMIAADKAASNMLDFICQPCTQEGREKTWDNQDCETVVDSIVDGLKKIIDLCDIKIVESRTTTFNSYVARYHEQVCEYIDKKRSYSGNRQSAEFFRKSIKKTFKDADAKNSYVKSCSEKIIALFNS